MRQPGYFKNIQRNASKRWAQLEGDPELAGPWRQLFLQVQSPRHVVSELLQNADDAGATKATVEVNGSEFIFTHNGEDFDEQQFASLCRFGFSNKRTLHTIGFRGVGFKSTFSLGDEVRLFTPTLSVAFHKQRFTEPQWTESNGATAGQTEVRVAIQSERIRQELGKNLQEWSESPASLLFFKNIRCLQVHERELRWESQGTGPIERSEWMSVSTAPSEQYLIIRSSEEDFPEDALQEIRDERMASDEETTFPPCQVEIVLGMEGRLFVVLPTGVKTELPFACNAPFIQDPARMKIKDPALSPTNGWLLRRAGELAADTMLAWVSRKSLCIEERCRAYGLLPDVDRQDNSVEGSCATIVEESFEAKIEGAEFLLTEAKTLAPSNNCLAVPGELLDIWSPAQVSASFSAAKTAILSRHVSDPDRKKLIHWGYITNLTKVQVLETLEKNRLPRPRHWQQLLNLWNYVAPEVNASSRNHRNVRIVPVQGKDLLYAHNEVVRLGERRTLRTDDWEFLAPYLLVLDSSWTRWLSQRRPTSETTGEDVLKNQLEAATNIFRALGLTDSTDMDRVMSKVSDSFFTQESPPKIRDCVRLAHIAARLGAAVNDQFKFVTEDGQLRTVVRNPILADVHGDLDMFVDAAWYQNHGLNNAYGNVSEICTDAEWRQWVQSPGSRLRTFVPLVQTATPITGRDRLREILGQRGFDGELYFHYKHDNFRLFDWEFPSRNWDHWTLLAQDDEFFWGRLLTRILQQPQLYWSGATDARAFQVGTTGNIRAVTQEHLIPRWIIRLRDLPCLSDTLGKPRQPAELLRRTPETEPFVGVQPFIKAELDTEAVRPLLILLGVRDKPTGPERLLERLQALASSSTPLVPEVQKWCHSLDQLFDRCSTEEIRGIKTAFTDRRLILTDTAEWASADEVFLNSDEDGVPGAALIHPALREFAIWRKIGIPERPTADMEIEWLKGLPSSGKLTPAQARRIRRLLPVYPSRIWDETRHWLNLEGDWAPAGSLVYSLTMQSLVSWSHLFPTIKGKTADFRPLSSETCQNHPFSSLQRLGDVIEERFQGQSGLPDSQVKPWLVALGNGLRRVVLDDAEQTGRVRELAHRLAQTRLQVAWGIESEPYIDGKPAGTPRPIEVYWQANTLYVQNGSPAKMAKVVPQEIGRAFERSEITEAIKLCYERSTEFIDEYLEESFDLSLIEEVEPEPPEGPDMSTENGDAGGKLLLDASDGKFDAGGADAGDQDQVYEDIDEFTDLEPDDGELSPGPARRPRPQQPSVIERFAQSRGFAMNGNGRLDHPDGSWLERTRGNNVFPWALRFGEGELVQYYWPKEHCIQQEPLHLEAEIWDLCEKFPDFYSLILTDSSGHPREISGALLVEMRKQETLVLHSAAYRLVYRGGDS